MTTSTTIRCENLACLCEIPATEASCSPACATPEAKDPQNVRCACEHSHCTDQIEAQLHGEAGHES